MGDLHVSGSADTEHVTTEGVKWSLPPQVPVKPVPSLWLALGGNYDWVPAVWLG